MMLKAKMLSIVFISWRWKKTFFLERKVFFEIRTR
jgi:hypothetical protein